MKLNRDLYLSTSPQLQPTGKTRSFASLNHRQRLIYGRKRCYHTGKEQDSETGLYYYGARYLDSRTSRWISGDPAVGEYIPSAPVNDEARKRNGNLPGMGGIFNYVNLHVYHYAGNNPVLLRDPNGRTTRPLEPEEWANVKEAIDFAVTNLDSIINELTDYASGNSQSISDETKQSASSWLGINVNSKTTAGTFASDLKKIRNKLASLDNSNFSWDDALRENRVAEANTQTGNISIDPFFFELPDQGGDFTKLGILVHEASHLALNTYDITYYADRSRGLAKNSPATAHRNAANWEYFINEYVNLRSFRRGP